MISQALGHDARRRPPTPADGTARSAQIEPLTTADVASAVEFAVRVLRVKPGDRGEQFASDITDDLRQMFVAKAIGHLVAYRRVIELGAGEAGPGTPAGCYLSGVLVDPAWRRRGIATELTRARLRSAFARTGTVYYVTGRITSPPFSFTQPSVSTKSSASGASGPPLARRCCRSSRRRRREDDSDGNWEQDPGINS